MLSKLPAEISEKTIWNFDQKISPSFCKLNNFGDALNQLIANEVFSPLLGNSFTCAPDSSSVRLYGIGSYLSKDFLETRSKTKQAIIAGMGAGYMDLPVQQSYGFGAKFPVWIKNELKLPLPKLTEVRTEGYRILFVRGPLTARLLGLPESVGFADAGYLLRRTKSFQDLRKLKRSGISFMPHYTAATCSPGLRDICEATGFRYINPCDDVDVVLNEIATSEVLMTEALHGAVISDAMRVPWIPLKSSEDIFDFKWLDFTSGINKQYCPNDLKVSWNRVYYSGRRPSSLLKNATTRVRSLLTRFTTQPKDTALSLLKASATIPILSAESTLDEIDRVLTQAMIELQKDCVASTGFASSKN